MNLCIVSHFAYGALAGGDRGHIGGVERQTTLLARWLAARGHRVSLVTWDEGQPVDTAIEGVRVVQTCARHGGIPGLRFFHPRWTSLAAALERADASVYYHNCGEYVTGQVAMWCSRHGKSFVYSAAAQADCDVRLPLMTTWRDRALYKAGIRRANRIIVQTDTQRRMLTDGFGLDSVVIPMPCPGPDDVSFQGRSTPGPDAPVLWVGRICDVKRPDRFVDLATACPDLPFELVGPSDGTEYAQKVLERAGGVPNLRVVGGVSRAQIDDHYRHALCLCCTSDFEGFPNTFLEAWSVGLPVVSTWDPDDLIETAGLGTAADDVDSLGDGIRRLAGSREVWHGASQRARSHYLRHHTVDRVMAQFERVFLEAGDSRSHVQRRGAESALAPHLMRRSS